MMIRDLYLQPLGATRSFDGRYFLQLFQVRLSNDGDSLVHHMIGACSLEQHPYITDAVITHSQLNAAYRNKGYGKKMYQQMFLYGKSRGWQVYSSEMERMIPDRDPMSKDARRLWESLERDPELNVQRINNRWRVG